LGKANFAATLTPSGGADSGQSPHNYLIYLNIVHCKIILRSGLEKGAYTLI